MNILFLTLLDFQDVNEFGIYTDLIRAFISGNHNVSIISPTERRKKTGTNMIKTERCELLKLKIGNVQKTGIVEKGLSTLILEHQFKNAIRDYFSNVKFDLVLYSTPPVTLYRAVEFVKKRDSAKTYLLLKDILPQGAVDLNVLKKKGFYGLIYKYFKHKERSLYQISDFIGCMSEANVKYLLEHNDYISANQVEVCPNSIQPQVVNINLSERDDVRKKYQIPLDITVFIYGGNLGKPQGIDFLIECIRENEKNIQSYFLIVGSGTEFNKLENFFNMEKPKNAKLLNQLPKNDYEILANSCDVGLIFLDKRFTIPNFPSRILSYMQANMPVIAATDKNTDIGETIINGEFGFWCESSDASVFNSYVKKLSDVDLVKKMGENARKYLENHYTSKHSYEIIMKHFKNEEKGQ